MGVYGGRTIYSPALVVITAHGGARVSHETLTLGIKITTLVARVPKTIYRNKYVFIDTNANNKKYSHSIIEYDIIKRNKLLFVEEVKKQNGYLEIQLNNLTFS